MDPELRTEEEASGRRIPEETGKIQTSLQTRQRIPDRSIPEGSRQKMGRSAVQMLKIERR